LVKIIRGYTKAYNPEPLRRKPTLARPLLNMPAKPEPKLVMRNLKQILIRIRNGGFITPAIQEIEELFKEKTMDDFDNEIDARMYFKEKPFDKQKSWKELPPMGVSEWKQLGRKWGYFDFFEKQIKQETLDIISEGQGWEESYDIFAEKLGLPKKFNKLI